MNKIFGGLVVQFREFFKNLGPTKRLSVIAVSVIALVAILTMLFMASGKDYVPLFTNIPTEQVSTIVAKLNEKNIPFQLRDDGKTVAIPKELLHSTQMTLMSEIGSPKMGSVGLEMFEKQDFGMNSYAQKINYQRALQGELMRAINTLTAVKQSKVILALPNKKTFLEEGGQASASVVVELHQGKELAPEQVRGIRYLVANAVEGMDADKVTVLDERGKVLTRTENGATGGSNELLDLKAKIEGDLENRIEDILSKVVGHAKVVAKVDATLNHRVISSVEESVDPDKTAIRSQQSEEESLDGSRTNPAGVPGSRSNLPGAEDQGTVGFRQDVKKEIKTTNYEVPKTVRNIREAAGGLERVSVAVVVDGIAVTTTKPDGTTETKYQPRSAEDLKKYEDLVKNAIGFNSARGDSVRIESMQFQPEDFSEAEKILTTLERKKLIHALFKWALLGFSLALFFFIVVRPFMQWITDSFQDSVEEMLPRTIEELEELQSVDNTLPGMSTALPVLQESIDPEKAESELLKDRIMATMSRDEEKAANAFGMWLVRKDG
ncbi:flagellar basal-body MS-ring/collar protein FliF [Bdellovibrio sp. 22V]|uniref:flagellar basal-body MS-ring/collar protein FliF n=1 Tax=Bdellovibrio TaxID=958 RepID=UPI002542B3BE|nr:flagellar basal-body MS-ring/collar protein FliF [Bdellovibrio sp. 22V]WII72397.1 flagellar basal-body MS-ring/collar protein FliF [Bdellovibrio sp. 22V]